MQIDTDQNSSPPLANLLGIPGITEPLVVRIGVTGHKQLEERFSGGEELASSVKLMVEAVMKYLDMSMAHTPRKYQIVSPLAEGGDILLTSALLRPPAAPEVGLFEIPELLITLPMPLAQYRDEFVVEKQKVTFDELMGRSTNPNEIPLLTEANTREQRSSAYKAVTKAVAEKCDVLIALWDGRPTDSDAGTAATVSEARRLGKPVVHLRPTLTNRYFLRLLSSATLPWFANRRLASPFFPFCGIRILDDDDSVLTSLRHLDLFNLELQEQVWTETDSVLHLADTDATLRRVRDAYNTLTSPLNSNPLTNTYFDNNYGPVLSQVLLPVRERTSWLARHYQKRYNRWVGTCVYLLAAAAVATVATIKLFLPTYNNLYWLEVTVAVSILFIIGASKYYDWHRKRIEYRILAERLRAAVFLHIAGLAPERLSTPVYFQAGQSSNRWIIRIFDALTLHMVRVLPWPMIHFDALKDLIAKSWLADQLAYYEHEGKRQHSWAIVLEATGLIAFLLTILIAVTHALRIWEHYHYLDASTGLLSLSLPALGGAIGGILVHREYRRNARRYHQMARALDPILQQVESASDFTQLQVLLRAAHHLMLWEQQTWLLTVGTESRPAA